jgi:hypothetical protein
VWQFEQQLNSHLLLNICRNIHQVINWTEFFVLRLEFVGSVVGYVLHIVHLESVSDLLVCLCVPASNDVSWIVLTMDVQSRVHMTTEN